MVCFILTHWPHVAVILKVLQNMSLETHYTRKSLDNVCEIALRWMPKDHADEKSTLVQVIAISWANIDLDPCRHMTPIDHNELISLIPSV